MPQVLLAQPSNWISASRLPAMLAREGIDCDPIDRGKTYAAASSHVRTHTVIPKVGDLAPEILRVADEYDRVVLCNERLIRAVMRVGGPDADRLLRGSQSGLASVCDKTLFPPAARAGGVRVADFEVVGSSEETARAAARLGGRVVVKGRWGAGGSSVRVVDSPAEAALAAEELKFPALVEAFVAGELVNAPCLYENGKLVAALACRKLELVADNGPSSINGFIPIDDRLLAVCERLGEVFGLTGFASADVFLVDDGAPVVIELNPRPVAQHHVGRALGVDMARAFADVLADRWDGTPRLAHRTRTVPLFPQSLAKRHEMHGPVRGTMSWLTMRGSLADVPWDDLGLLKRHTRELLSTKR